MVREVRGLCAPWVHSSGVGLDRIPTALAPTREGKREGAPDGFTGQDKLSEPGGKDTAGPAVGVVYNCGFVFFLLKP